MVKGKVKYLGAGLKNPKLITQEFEYDDSWLRFPSNLAPYEMLEFSLCAAQAAFLEDSITDLFDQIGYKYTNSVNEEREELNILAGDEIVDSVYYPAQIINEIPYYNSIGYAIGSKKIDDFTAIFVAVRGGMYGIEWSGDFNMGTGENHEGFQIASDQVLLGLKKYIGVNFIEGKKKVWLVGYSRGAAVANLTAARIIDGEIKGFDPEDVFSFCFECPRVTKNPDVFAECYNGIQCVVNPNDAVPKMPAAFWGFNRFGITHFLPSYESDANFEEKYNLMLPYQLKLLPKVIGYATNDGYTQETFVNDFAIAAGTQRQYVKYYQSALMQVATKYLGGIGPEPSDLDLLTLKDLFDTVGDLNPANSQRVLRLLDVKPAKKGFFTLNLDCPLIRTHWTETVMGWIKSLKGYEGFGPDTIRIAYINGVRDVEVVDNTGKVLVKVKDGELEKVKNGLWAQFNPNSQLVVVLPANGTYELSFKNPSKGVMNYSVAEFNLNYGCKRKVVDYGQIPIDDSDGLRSLVRPMGSENTYSLSRAKETLQPERILTGDEVGHFIIRIKVEGDGHAIGGGEFSQGEVVGLYANPEEGKKFYGWFIGDELVSNQPVFEFLPKESLEIKAKFMDE